jgi:hypothetical protein
MKSFMLVRHKRRSLYEETWTERRRKSKQKNYKERVKWKEELAA